MVRKKPGDANLTIDVLLDSAEILFLENGVAATTLDNIAKTAGLTRGAIYWHFTDKDDLLQAMFSRAVLPVESILNELGHAGDLDSLHVLRKTFIQVLMTLAKSPEQQRVFSILFHRCEYAGNLIANLENKRTDFEQCQKQVKSTLMKAVDAGYLPPDTDVTLASQFINNFITGTMRRWLFAPQEFALEECSAAMVDVMLSGLIRNPPILTKS